MHDICVAWLHKPIRSNVLQSKIPAAAAAAGSEPMTVYCHLIYWLIGICLKGQDWEYEKDNVSLKTMTRWRPS